MGSLRQTSSSAAPMVLVSDFTQSIHLCFGLPLLLLLAVPMLLWGRCGRHNSPPASSVVDILLRCSDGSRVGFHTVYPSLLWSSSSSFSSSSSPSCSHVVVGSLWQTEFSSSQFCRGHPPPLLRWFSRQISRSLSISALVFLFFFSRAVPSPVFVFPHILVLVSTCSNHLCLTFMHLSVFFSIVIRSLMFSFLTWE